MPNITPSNIPYIDNLVNIQTETTGLSGFIDYFLPVQKQSWGTLDYRRARLLIIASFLTGCIFQLFELTQRLSPASSISPRGLALLSALLFWLIPLILKYSQNIWATARSYVAFVFCCFGLVAFHTKGLHSPILYPMFVVQLTCFLLTSRWFGWFSIGASALFLVALWMTHRLGMYPHIQPDLATETFQVLVLFTSYGCTGLILQFFQNDRLRVTQVAVNAFHDFERTREEALKANDAKSIFLAGMSHELRTPLTAIIGHTEIVKDNLEDQDIMEHHVSLERIDDSAHHLLNLLNKLLDLSKLEAGKIVLSPEPTLLHPLIEEVVNTSYPLACKNNNQFTFDTNALPTSTKCVIDPLRLKQILLNLISNACKFTKDGAVSLTVRLNKAEQTLHFIVMDDGIGMSSEQQKKLFQPFTQADAKTASRYGGTGLGLYLSRELCVLMQGDIHIESALNEGASFEVILPLVQVTVDQTTSSHSK